MLYHLLYPLYQQHSVFNICRYISFRSVVAFIVATLISIIWGKYFIAYMHRRQFGQIVRDDGPQDHLKKAGTPTMGGILILGSMLAALLVAGNFSSLPFNLTLLVTLSFFVLGFIDDYRKVMQHNTKGMRPLQKLAWQGLTGVGVGCLLYYFGGDTQVYVPFFKGPVIDLGMLYIFWVGLVIVASSNAVNLTDGLDGLAVGPIVTSMATLGALAYLAGHWDYANYLFIPYVANAGELLVLAAAVIGAAVGFLWYNSYPAQVFMGDVGSLSLGGLLGTVAILTKNEILFIVIGGIFVAEALSVILQVGSFKIRHKRIFRMAPIHHQFELLGWKEPKVIVRFWIVSLLLALLAIATLKIR